MNPRSKNLSNRQPVVTLTYSQKRAVADYHRILTIVGLDVDSLLERAADDPEAILPVIRSMKEQVVRGEVIEAHTWLDFTLEHVLLTYFAGKRRDGEGIGARRQKTLELVFGRIYLLRKLKIICSFRKVPKEIVSIIGEINRLRNVMAHEFFVSSVTPRRRYYRGQSIFGTRGLTAFITDYRKAIGFFDPVLRDFDES